MCKERKNPIISIIVPVYNVEKYLKRCIDSILNQTFKDFELILVNDGSTDGCKEICNQYKKLDNRIKVINKENGGLSSARNVGLDIAKGKYIGFVDSDDYVSDQMYEKLYEDITINKSDIAICEYEYIYENTIIDKKLNSLEIINYNCKQVLDLFYTSKYPYIVVAWNKLYKREIFDEIRYPIGKINEDGFIIDKLICKCRKITYNSSKLYYYYQRDNSIMNSKFSLKNLDKLEYLSDRIEFFKEKGFLDLSKKAKSDFVFEFLKLYFKGKSELQLPKNKLKEIKKIYNKNVVKLITEKSYSIKERILFILFFIDDRLYEVCRNNKIKVSGK